MEKETMYCVYILKSQNFGKTYVGVTLRDPITRLREHNDGKSKYTSRYIPWNLVYYELLHCKTCAFSREQFFKSGVGVKIKNILVDNLEVS